jgi:hypothetical protein
LKREERRLEERREKREDEIVSQIAEILPNQHG